MGQPLHTGSPAHQRHHPAGQGTAMATMKPGVCVTHVVFDMDGLLLDTEKIYTEVTKEISRPYGKEYTWATKQKVMVQTEKFAACSTMPGADRLVNHLHKHNIPMAVATSSNSFMFDVKTQRHGELFRLFSHVVKGDDPEVVRGKPDPLIFQIASSRFPHPPASPANVVVFEDAPSGVQAASAAEMNAVWVRDVHLDASLCGNLPLYTLTSLEQFDPAIVGLPPYDD